MLGFCFFLLNFEITLSCGSFVLKKGLYMLLQDKKKISNPFRFDLNSIKRSCLFEFYFIEVHIYSNQIKSFLKKNLSTIFFFCYFCFHPFCFQWIMLPYNTNNEAKEFTFCGEINSSVSMMYFNWPVCFFLLNTVSIQ